MNIRNSGRLFQALKRFWRPASIILEKEEQIDTLRHIYIPQYIPDIDTAINHLFYTIPFVESLIENHDFTSTIADHSRVLRTTNPIFKGKPLHVDVEGYFEIAEDHEFYEVKYYQRLISQIIRERTIRSQYPIELSKKGRILGFDIGMTTHDGAPNAACNGFVDMYDAPPIDTWFHVQSRFPGTQEGVLFCWIPKAAEARMQDAIDVEILDSYFWLDEKFPTIQEEFEGRIKDRFKK